MATYQPPKINTAFIMYISVVSQADTKIMQDTPTIAAGDFQVSTDGGALGNLTTLPTVTPAAGVMIKISLSATEMNGDNITLVCKDAAGAEWCDLTVNIQTSANQIDDLATPTNITAGTITTVTNLTNLPAITANWLTAAGTAADFGTEVGTAVWATTARILTASTNFNDIAATDIVSAGAITTLTGAVVNVDLVDTLTTYTGNTPQTADHTAGIADIPTVAEFNARTILSADYFDPATDAVANVTLCATTTTNTDAITVSDILTTAMTEAYAADGVAPTLAQAVFLIQQMLAERGVVGTVLTISKLDGTTAAATFTLDDGTNPTDQTRAT